MRQDDATKLLSRGTLPATGRVEDAALCHCTAGCVHTPGAQTENRSLREIERKRER